MRLIVFLLSAAILASPAIAKELTSDQGIFVDLPSGFTPGEGDGKTRFSYFAPDDGVELDILIYEAGRFSSAAAMAAEHTGKLASTGDSSAFTYEGREAVIADLSFALDEQARRGYGLFVHGNGAEPSCSLLAHADAASFDAYGELIISCLDSFSIDRAARRAPGPVSQFLLSWPPDRLATRTAALPGGPADLPWSAEEAQQEIDIAEREYDILVASSDSDTLWMDAWGRFYRMVYRESASRLDGLIEELAGSLPEDDPTEAARRVLAWVQGFSFERGTSGMDFVTPLAAAFGNRGDCDSRALVMAIVLEALGIDCVLMLSREYSHAMLAVDVPGGGQRFTHGGRQYLVAETTAKVGIGMIEASQADWSKWMGVDLGN